MDGSRLNVLDRQAAFGAVTRLRPFGVVASSAPRRFWAFVVAGALGTVISSTVAGSGWLGMTTSAELVQRFGGAAALFLSVVSAPAWALFVVLPLFSLRAAARGALFGRILLTLVAVLNVAPLFQSGLVSLWWVGLVCAAALCVAATIAWSLPRRPAVIAPMVPVPSVRRRRFRSAASLFAVAGMIGAHSVYLRRGWQCALYVALLWLAFVTHALGAPVSVLLILVSSLMLFSDFARLDTAIDLANERSLAKS